MNFNDNYNNKLNCDIFTTIRKSSSKYKINDVVPIELNGTQIGDAKIISIKTYSNEDLRKNSSLLTIIRLDTGLMSYDEFIRTMIKCYSDNYKIFQLTDPTEYYTVIELKWISRIAKDTSISDHQ